ncbi:metallopeptidase TldD-related protein [Variovorax sp. KK3]|uniref:metallopeptidase TldD-related protein n=1 Tax=Variovorax sp. KK3 TaxID=1855728 RepID=UPI00117C603C|nr:metallopeptidase TldD-related protein [Variovorax sp. KK3]
MNFFNEVKPTSDRSTALPESFCQYVKKSEPGEWCYVDAIQTGKSIEISSYFIVAVVLGCPILDEQEKIGILQLVRDDQFPASLDLSKATEVPGSLEIFSKFLASDGCSLTTLSISLSDQVDARPISQGIALNQSIARLKISCRFGELQQHLVDAVALNASVSELAIFSGRLGVSAMNSIGLAISQHPTLQAICFKSNRIDDDGMENFVLHLREDGVLKKLAVEDNNITDLSVKNLFSSSKKWETLHISNCVMKTRGHVIAELLAKNSHTVHLALRFSHFAPTDIEAIFKALHNNKTLRTLDLTNWLFSCPAAVKTNAAELLRNNSTLTHLRLDELDNPPEIEKMLQQNRDRDRHWTTLGLHIHTRQYGVPFELSRLIAEGMWKTPSNVQAAIQLAESAKPASSDKANPKE